MLLPPELTAQAPGGPQSTRASSRRPASTDRDLGWPRAYDVAGGAALLYQPQVERWDGQKQMIAWSAVAYRPTGARKPVFGAIRFVAGTNVSTAERLVSLIDFTITESYFPELSPDQSRDLVTSVREHVLDGRRVIALDPVLAAIDKSDIGLVEGSDIKADPPRIFVSTTPAVLLSFDGQPVWSPIKDLDLNFAVNTNWDVFEDQPSNTLYLRNDDSWLRADNINGRWQPAGDLPASFNMLPVDGNWTAAKGSLPGRRVAAKKAPKVFVTAQPAELLLLDGEPAYRSVPGTSLLWISNTDSDLFRVGRSGPFFYLVAGRWFSSPDLKGPWTFATSTLPADFRKIPVEHPRSRVLASVPGTEQAIEAVLLAEIPQTARVSLSRVGAPAVSYEGQPHFQLIPGTLLYHGVNTDKDIIRVGLRYYMCFQAVWFVSDSPNGRWEVATSVPEAIYGIPVSSPVHNVTYVTIEQDDNPHDDWVTFAYSAGYTGTMIAWGCAVWGTGWYYLPYVATGRSYPAYYGFPGTYGLSASYNPWTGGYGRGAAGYGPDGGAYSSYLSRPVTRTWNPRTGVPGATRPGSNIYRNWGSGQVQPADDWAQTPPVTATGGSKGGASTRSSVSTTIARGEADNVYAGRDGNVYRRQRDGAWQTWNNGKWGVVPQPVDTSGGTTGRGPTFVTRQLDRDWNARVLGTQRSRVFNSFRDSPTELRGASYRADDDRR